MRRIGLALAAALALGGPAPRTLDAAPADPRAEYAVRAARVRAEEADALRKLASWGDRNGLERTAETDWQLARDLDPSNEEASRRLRYVKRGAVWVRDEASAALARPPSDSRPDRLLEYAVKRVSDVRRPIGTRRRELAAWCRQQGLADAADAELRAALALDPSDPWAHLAQGEVVDRDEGWVPLEVRERRTADARAGAVLRRLGALRSDPIRQEGEGPNTTTLGFPTSLWRLREWTLETDLDDDAAAQALATVDLGARWFRDYFDLPVSEPVLPHGGSFLVLSTAERYLRAIEAEPRLSAGEKRFAKGLGAMPVEHTSAKAPWHVILERPTAEDASDGCLHLGIHFLMEARFGVVARDAWLYEGLAAYAVFRIAQTNYTWCVNLEQTSAKVTTMETPDASHWAEVALQTVARRDDFALRGLFGASLNNLDAPMLVKSWSVVRWLLEEHADEARAFLAEKAQGATSEVALERATGLRVEDVDELWRRHVLATEGE